MEKFDVTVIGAGPGGYPAAIRAAQLGAKVAIIESEALGGTCLNWGCIPTKALIASADLFARMKRSEELGLKPGRMSFDYRAMSQRKDEVVTKLRSGVEQLLKSNGIKVFQGIGSFINRNRIAVNPSGKIALAGQRSYETVGKSKAIRSVGAPPRFQRGKPRVYPAGGGGAASFESSPVKQETIIEAGSTIIATGSESAMPGFLPKSKRVVDSKVFLGLSELPSSIMVLGGGMIGCEFACMAARLGVKVIIVEILEDILITLDADIRRELRRGMEKELGIHIVTGKEMTNVQAHGPEDRGQKSEVRGKKKAEKVGVSGMIGKERVEAEILLVAVGRRPMTKDLGLEKAGLETNEAGFIEVDEFCRTSMATIYAVGDVTGGLQLAHAATSQGITAAENAVLGARRRVETVIPSCMFTWPEIGTVGMAEHEAEKRGINVKTGKFMFAGLGKAMAAGEPKGFVKWVANVETGQLVGAHAVGPHATELIAEAAVAIRAELTAEEVGRTIHCHPTFSEAWMEAAHAVQGECIHAPPKRKHSLSG